MVDGKVWRVMIRGMRVTLGDDMKKKCYVTTMSRLIIMGGVLCASCL